MKGHQPLPLRFRVLVVDDEEFARNSTKLPLIVLGLEPVIAVGDTFEQLRDSAGNLVRSQRCHLALVDTQLRTGDRTDQSGVSLIPELKPAYCIVYSGSGKTDAAAMSRAHKLGAVDYAKKPKPNANEVAMNEAPDLGVVARVTKGENLSSVVIRVLKEYWNWELVYDLRTTRHTPETILAQLFPPGSEISPDAIPIDEIESLLRRAFVKGTRLLELESLEGILHTGTTPSLRRSVVLSCEARDEETKTGRREIIKLAPAGDIVRETHNYEHYVKPFLQHQYTALVLDQQVSWDIGIIRYTDETTGRRRRFTEWYADNQPHQITQAIKNLYEKVLKPWYDLGRGEANKSRASIFEYYTEPSRFRRFSSHIISFTEREITITGGRLSGSINPVAWVEQNKEQSWFRTYWSTFVHGDLHSGNVIVDDEAQTYVIDYERTGPGYCLRDFVELEKDVLLRLLDLEDDELMLALHLDLVLMKQIRPDRFPRWEDPRLGASTIAEENKRELLKAFTAVRSIRRAASRIIEFVDMREYYWALLMETLISATNPRLVSNIRQRAMLCASVICERLQLWNRPQREWPPKRLRDMLSTQNMGKSEDDRRRSAHTLKLHLSSMGGDSFKVAVLDLPNQQPSAIGQQPFRSDGLVVVMKLLEPGGYQPDKFSSTQTAALEQLGLLDNSRLVHNWCDRIGDHLFKALVPARGGVRTAFEGVFYHLDHTSDEHEAGELQVIFDKDTTSLACQPWEMIHDGYPEDSRTPIDVVRYIASDRPAQTLEVPQAPCQILYVTARPKGYAEPAHDRDAIKDSVASSASPWRLGFNEFPDRTHHALKQRLLDTSAAPVHVLHFDGHGTFARLCPSPTCGAANFAHESKCDRCGTSLDNVHAPARGYLLFEDDQRKVKFIDTTRFLEGVQRSQVRLVVLSSCHSARVRGADLLLAGVGPGLILAGVPAVVAMQFSISDQDAIKFNQQFYKALAQGDSLPNAVYRGRLMLAEPARWSPVLYLRSKDHQIHLCPPK